MNLLRVLPPIPVGREPDDVFAGDVDLDGDLDPLVASLAGEPISVLLNPVR